MTISQAFELKDLKYTLVKPYAKIQHPETMQPALWDLLFMDSYMPVIFFYRPEALGTDSGSFAQTVAHLKESLSKVLVKHYPFAGRWIKTFDERVRLLLCNDEGVPFFEARVDEEMDTVIGVVDDFRPVPALGNFNLVGLNNLFFQHDVDFPMPAVFFQVTGFKCGGISLYAGFSHQSTDGKGFFDFMANWSQQAMHDKLAVDPVHDRSITLSLADFMGWMSASSDAEKSASVPEAHAHGNSSNPYGYESQVNGTSAVPKGGGVHNENGKHVPNGKNGKHVPNGEAVVGPKIDPGVLLKLPIQIQLCPKTLLVRKEAVQHLKKQAVEENLEDYVTTVDCVTSQIWRGLNSLEPQVEFRQTRLRTRPTQGGKPVEFVLSTAVDCRKRCHKPPLPDSYSPNCLFIFQTPRLAPSAMLSKSHLEVARIFHKTVREITPTTWNEFLKVTILTLFDFGDTDFRHVLMTSWMTFPMYSVEFGQGLGKPFFVGVNLEGGFLPEGICFFLPPRPGSPAAANVQFFLQDDVLQALLSHKQFRSFFH